MTKQETIKKTPIGQIGRNAEKVTIADEIELTTKYHIEPPIEPNKLATCWLDPSEREEGYRVKTVLTFPDGRQGITNNLANLLRIWLKAEALERIFTFEEENRFSWAEAKRKVLKRFNLKDLKFNSMANLVHSIYITSNQPLYDEDAHPNRVRNVLRAVKVRYPSVHFEHEGCWSSGACPIGLADALRKLALETHGKVNNDD